MRHSCFPKRPHHDGQFLRIEEAAPASGKRPRIAGGSWWKKGIGGAVAVVLLVLGKLEFLLLGLTKASTFFSMFAFFGVYWSTHGWPLALGLVALAVYAIARVPVWLAIAELNGYVNLFNLTPVWQLDGSRGFHALSRRERWVVVAVIALAFLLTGQKLLIIVGAVAVWRAVQREVGPGSGRVLATFVVLLGALAWMAAGVG